MTRQTGGIGPLLRQARTDRGWSHEDVAHRIDASLASYSRWERGKNVPQGRNLQQLIDVLDLDPAAAVAAAGGAEAPGVQAERALDSAAELATEVARLNARIAELEALVPDEEALRATIDAIVAARLAEAAATGGAPPQPDERRRGGRASAG